MDFECLTVSVVEAGRLLGYSRNTAYEAIQRGELPVIKFGRKMRVPKAALERLLTGTGTAGTTSTAVETASR